MSQAYPYPDTPLLPQWRNHKAQAQAMFALAMAVGATLFAPHASSPHAIALLIILPAALSFTLAFAPNPTRDTSQITKDLFVLAAALAVFAGPHLGVLVASAPFGLVAGIAIGEARAWFGRQVS